MHGNGVASFSESDILKYRVRPTLYTTVSVYLPGYNDKKLLVADTEGTLINFALHITYTY